MPDLSQIPTDQLMQMIQGHPELANYQEPQKPQEQGFMNNLANSTYAGLTKAGTGMFGLGVDAMDKMGFLDPGIADEEKNIISGARANALSQENNPTTPGATHFIGENIVGNPFTMMGGGIPGMAAGGALSSATDVDPAASAGKKALMGTYGAGLSAATGYALNKLFSPAKVNLTPEQQRLAAALQDEGINLRPAQLTGNKAYRTAESAFQSLPITSGVENKLKVKNLEQYTKAVLSKAGITADEASPEVLAVARDQIGGTIGNITSNATMPITKGYKTAVQDTVNEYLNSVAPSNVRPGIEKLAKDITTGKSLNGDVYQATRSKLGKMLSAAFKSGDADYGQALGGIQEAMDDAMTASLPPAQATALQEARGQYGNLKTIMKAMGSTGKEATSGYVSPQALAAALKGNNANKYVMGGGDLNDLARGGNIFLKNAMEGVNPPPFKPSDIMEGGPAMAGIAAGYHAGGIPGALYGAATTVGLPVGAQALYNTKPMQNFLINGSTKITPEMRAMAAILAGKQEGNFVSGE